MSRPDYSPEFGYLTMQSDFQAMGGTRVVTMIDDFTESGYRALLHSFRRIGYDAVTYDECDMNRRHLLLRHDIDMSPSHAVVIARIEADAALRATYFVLVRTSVYNPFSKENLTNLCELIRLGHQVGLHFDASLYSESPDELDAAVRTECEILEQMLSQPIRIVSFHRPSKVLLNYADELGGRQHTYSPRFFRDIAYCS